MKYKILFTDIDGTLFNNQKTISKDVLDGINRYTDMGGRIVLSSGRPLKSILKIADRLGLRTAHMYIIAFNGAMVYDVAAENVIWQKRIPANIVRQVLDLAHEMNIQCHTYTDDDIISERDTQMLRRYMEHVTLPCRIIENVTDYFASIGNYEPYKLLAITGDNEQLLKDFAKKIDVAVGDSVHTFFSAYCFLECCMRDASKGNAVRFLCEHLDIDVADTVAAGDAANDISMLQAAGISYAMLNGTDDVKAVADRITQKTNDEDGILEILEMMLSNN